jgi:hypothetical protein
MALDTLLSSTIRFNFVLKIERVYACKSRHKLRS